MSVLAQRPTTATAHGLVDSEAGGCPGDHGANPRGHGDGAPGHASRATLPDMDASWHWVLTLGTSLLAACSSSSEVDPTQASTDASIDASMDAAALDSEGGKSATDSATDEASSATDATDAPAVEPDAEPSDAADAPEASPLFYKNVVLDESGDPDCSRFGSTYYAYLPDQVRKNQQPVGGRVLGFSSKDLVHWTSLGEVFNNVDEAYGGQETIGLWAPEVLFHGGKYYLYYVNVMTGGADAEVGNKDIVVIQSDTPESFQNGIGRKVLLDDDHAFIDPSPFEDPVTHELYLAFKRRGEYGTGSDLRVRPMASPTAFGGAATVLIESENVANSFSVVEHPMLWRQGNLFYLLFSRGQGDRPTYGIAYATSKSITGPYEQRGVLFGSDGNLGGDVSKKVIAPGASSIVRDGAGATWMVYRQKKTAEDGWNDRGVCIDPIEVRPAEQKIVGTPTKGVLRPGPTPL